MFPQLTHVSDILLTPIATAANAMPENSQQIFNSSDPLQAMQYKQSFCTFRIIFLVFVGLISTVSIAVLLIYFYVDFMPQQDYFDDEVNKDYVYDSIRLPINLQPTYYRLRIHPRLDEDESPFTFNGSVMILMKCTEKTNRVILHVQNLNITKVYLQKENANVAFNKTNSALTEMKIEDCKKYRNTYLICKTVEDFENNFSYWLDTHFSGNITDDLVGLYRSKYYDEKGRKIWLGTTHFQPIHARRVFPCFDDPRFKSKFQISIARRTNMTVLSNMPLKAFEPMLPIKNGSAWVWDHFLETPPMSTYLVAFTISNFKNVDATLNKTGPILKIWTPIHLRSRTKFAANITSRIFNFYQDYLGSKYPLNKLDLIIIPDFAKGAMENWGLISFRDESLLFDERILHQSAPKRHIFNTIAHEIAHQWFGNSITCKWWSDLWLNEGFATYMAYIAEENLQPTWTPLNRFPQEILHSALQADSHTHNLHAVINKTEEIEQIFDQIMYNKAAALLRMLNFTLGNDSFLNGLKDYVQNLSFDSANETVLWSSFQKYNQNSNTSVKDFMKNWFENNGFPLLTVKRNYENGTLNIWQSKFGYENSKLTKWVIPLEYRTNYNSYGKIMFNSSYLQINTSLQMDEWVIFDINQSGYYRVNYDDKNWDLIISHIFDIPIINRGQIINDAFELANLGYLDYELPFKILNQLALNETSEEIWNIIFTSLSFLETIFIDTEHFGIYKEYLSKLIAPILEKEINGEQLLNVACNLKHSDCVDHAVQSFNNLKNLNNSLRIPKILNYPMLCALIENSDESTWEYVWNITRDKNISGIELITLYQALSCSTETWKIHSYLESMLDGKIQVQYISYIWRSLAKQPVGRLVGVRFLENKWKDIYAAFWNKMGVLQNIIEEFLYNLSSESDLDKVKLFSKKFKKELAPVSINLKVAIEKIGRRVQWRVHHMESVINIFKSFVNV